MSPSKRAVAAETWRMLMGFAMAQFGRTAGILQEMGLTPGHMKALLMLEPDEPRAMGALATSFACDASTMTWLVDRLEERELVERIPHPTDRRVKTVALTARGIEVKALLEARLYEPPEGLLELDRATLDELHDLLARLTVPSATIV